MDSLLEWLVFLALLAAPAIVTLRLVRARTAGADRPGSVAPEDDNRFWTLVATAIRLRCPVCKRGEIFPSWFSVRDRCPVCRVQLNRGDAGFFIGSAYFNYGTTGVLMTVAYLVCEFLFHWPTRYVLAGLMVFAVVFPLYFLRYARASFLVFDQYFAPRRPERPPTDDFA